MRSAGATPRARSRTFPIFRAIVSLGAGVDHLFADPALPDKPIVRVIDRDLTERMSKWVIMHALVHLRQLRRYERQRRERLWEDDDRRPTKATSRSACLGWA